MDPAPVDDATTGLPVRVPVTAARASRWPLALAIAVGIVSLLCASGLVIGYRLYDNATKPNRSAPDVVVDSYLRATLIDRNDSEANQFTCADPALLAPFEQYIAGVESREKQFHATTSFTWGPLTVSGSGNKAAVTVEITQSTFVEASGEAAESQHQWMFGTAKSSDWRVCGATQSS